MKPKPLTMEEALVKYMANNGYTALRNPELACGCTIDDLMPCGEPDIRECILAYTGKCNQKKCKDFSCEARGTVNETCITSKKPITKIVRAKKARGE